MWFIRPNIDHTKINHAGTCYCGNHPGSSQCFQCSFHVRPSKPHSNTGDKPGLVGILSFIAGQICRIAVGAAPANPNVRGKLANNLITQSEPYFGVCQSRPNAALRIIFSVKIGFGRRLQDQAIGQQNVVVAFQSSSGLTVLTDVGGRFGFKVIEGHALNTERSPSLWRPGFEVLSYAGDDIPPWTDGVPPKC